jgi:hypothetical protein
MSVDNYYDAFSTTTSCAIVLGAAASAAEKEISFDPDAPGVFIGDWIEIRLAANTYENASQFYGKKIIAKHSESAELSYEYLVDEVYRGISEFTEEQLVKYTDACISGYIKARTLSNGKDIRM